MDTHTQEQPGLTLDPFAFHGHATSCIAGLGGGGGASVPDPTYAFHTRYVAVARGHAHFTVRFTGLAARRGSLVLRVHMLPGEPGAAARMVTSHRVQLNWLSHHGGETRLRFEAFRGATYAVMGLVPDQTDAAAAELAVTLDRPADAAEIAAASASGEVSRPQPAAAGGEAIRPAAMLLSLDPPSFAHPVSQPCTAEQLREPSFRARVGGRAPDGNGDERARRWSCAYVVQVLDRYGLLHPGARGLALGDPGEPVLRAIAAGGATCRVVAPDIGTVGEGASEDLFGYDFLLSVRATDALPDDAAARAWLEGAMECLRPGGLAVHVVGFGAGAASLPRLRFDRNGLQRLALALISRGHEVARIKPAPTHRLVGAPDDPAVPFGLVARRAALIL